MVLHRPVECAAVTGQVGPSTKLPLTRSHVGLRLPFASGLDFVRSSNVMSRRFAACLIARHVTGRFQQLLDDPDAAIRSERNLDDRQSVIPVENDEL